MSWNEDRADSCVVAPEPRADRDEPCTCTGCGRPLPLISPANGQQREWSCIGCATSVTGRLDTHASIEALQNIGLVDSPGMVASLSGGIEPLKQMVRRLCVRTAYQGPERRRAPRYPIVLPATLTPVDGALIPLAKSYPAVTRDLSTGGISLVTAEVVECDFLMLDLFPPETARVHLLAKPLEFREFHTAILIRAALIMRFDRGGSGAAASL